MADQPDSSLVVFDIALDELHPNDWNANVMSEREAQAEVESIRRYGFLVPVVVRPNPWEEGTWELLDGQHRWTAARAVGLQVVPAVNVGEVPDEVARHLSLALTNRGTLQDEGLRGLLADLAPAMGDALGEALPWTTEELSGLLNDPPPPDPDADADEWFTFTARVPVECRPVLQAAELAAKDAGWEPHETPTVARGQLVEIMAASYLASAHADDDAQRAAEAGT